MSTSAVSSRGSFEKSSQERFAARRPRTASTDTNTFGASAASSGTFTTGDRPDSSVTKLRSTPSRSTVTSAVAERNGMRTWKRAT